MKRLQNLNLFNGYGEIKLVHTFPHKNIQPAKILVKTTSSLLNISVTLMLSLCSIAIT